jgi:G:T-mismatch repair DNA endonuclease (very short patch repair protein)
MRQPSRIVKYKAHFCCKKCRAAYRHSIHTKVVSCTYCGKSIRRPKSKLALSKNHFCNKLCHDAYQCGKPGYKPKTGSVVLCTVCGTAVYKYRVHLHKNITGRFYCSSKCMLADAELYKLKMLSNHTCSGPNKPEQKLIDFFKEQKLPYKYTGDGSFSVGRKIPDFVNINGEKKAIDMFGDYWHDPVVRKKLGLKIESPRERISRFKEYGWDLLVIWEKELKDTNWKNKILKRLEESCLL